MRGSAAAGPGEATGSTDADLQPYLSGSSKAPIPTYFIGSYGTGSTQAMQALSNATNNNLHYLGRAGLKTLTGLNIAFLDGTFDQTAYQSSLQGIEGSTGCAHYTQVIPDDEFCMLLTAQVHNCNTVLSTTPQLQVPPCCTHLPACSCSLQHSAAATALATIGSDSHSSA